jgi:hypothetical protein
MRQYFIESDTDGTPFSRNKRSIVYQRAKKQLDKRPFGTILDVYDPGFEWLAHSLSPKHPDPKGFRVMVGGPACTQPYSASVFNISAMSFGALSANAIKALNKGAKTGGFAHDTGEGSISVHHREFGGDLIWELGSGYFGCRNPDGSFSPEKFTAQARDPQIKMIEIKLSYDTDARSTEDRENAVSFGESRADALKARVSGTVIASGFVEFKHREGVAVRRRDSLGAIFCNIGGCGSVPRQVGRRLVGNAARAVIFPSHRVRLVTPAVAYSLTPPPGKPGAHPRDLRRHARGIRSHAVFG